MRGGRENRLEFSRRGHPYTKKGKNYGEIMDTREKKSFDMINTKTAINNAIEKEIDSFQNSTINKLDYNYSEIALKIDRIILSEFKNRASN